MCFRFVCGGVAVLLAAADSGAQGPIYTEAAARQGRQEINSICSRCHGIDGRGAKGPDLTDGVFRHARSDEDIVRIIKFGIPGTGMPGMGESIEPLCGSMIAYMRLEAQKRTDSASAPAGDVARGYDLFKKHQCASCHWTNSERGRRGTNLSRLSATPQYVRASLTDPDSQIDSAYQLVTLVLTNGTVLTGRRMHENTYHILVMDNQEALHRVAKTDIDRIDRPHKSMMPSFANALSARDVEDLTTYVFSIREAASP